MPDRKQRRQTLSFACLRNSQVPESCVAHQFTLCFGHAVQYVRRQQRCTRTSNASAWGSSSWLPQSDRAVNFTIIPVITSQATQTQTNASTSSSSAQPSCSSIPAKRRVTVVHLKPVVKLARLFYNQRSRDHQQHHWQQRGKHSGRDGGCRRGEGGGGGGGGGGGKIGAPRQKSWPGRKK